MELDKSYGRWKDGSSLLEDVAYSLYLIYRKNNIKPNYIPYTSQELFILGGNIYEKYYDQAELIIRREKILQLKSKNDKSKIE